MPEFKIERLVDAPADVVWSIISDVEGYAEVASNLSKAKIISGQGTGMKRQCWDTRGGTWLEDCILWEDGRRYSMVVDTSDYPYPFAKMQGTWGMEVQPNGVLVTMQFDYRPKYGPFGWLMDQVYIKPAFRRLCGELMDNWETEITTKSKSIKRN